MFSLLGSLFKSGRRVMDAVARKRHVGVDLHGNSYFVQQEDASQPLRRCVEYRDRTPCPSTVPVLWITWLRGYRDEPPTLAELREDDARMAALKERVARREAADEKLRVQEIAERRMSGRSEAQPDMSAQGMLRDMETQMEQQQSRWDRAKKG